MKVFPWESRALCAREILAYLELPWATPAIQWNGGLWLEIERCTPILEYPPERSRQWAGQLKDVITRVNQAGWWHRDVSLVNVVIHHERGPLLIDWEHLSPALSGVSYDLYGAEKAGAANQHPKIPGGTGACWNALAQYSPRTVWGINL